MTHTEEIEYYTEKCKIGEMRLKLLRLGASMILKDNNMSVDTFTTISAVLHNDSEDLAFFQRKLDETKAENMEEEDNDDDIHIG